MSSSVRTSSHEKPSGLVQIGLYTREKYTSIFPRPSFSM